MVFQISIDLELEDKDVHAVIDFDTGVIGFNEIVNEKEIEYNFYNCPVEYKMALLTKLEPSSASNRRMNFNVSRKSEISGLLRDHFQNQSH